MKIKKVRIQNLRAIKDLTVTFGPLTAFVGRNGSGKSTILRALKIFFEKEKVNKKDYYNLATDKEIKITITFYDLTDSAKHRFAKYIRKGELEVVCTPAQGNMKSMTKFCSYALANPDFAGVLAERVESRARQQYKAIASRPEYVDLPTRWPGLQKAKDLLTKWEEKHPDKCTWMLDNGDFFGYMGGGHRHMKSYVRFLYVSAARDAPVGGKGNKGSALEQLLDLTVEEALAEKPEYQNLPNVVKSAYNKVVNDKNVPELKTLEDNIGKTLRAFAGRAGIKLDWVIPGMIEMPRASVRLAEDGYSASVDMAGDGLQRAFMITALYHLSRLKADADDPDGDPADKQHDAPAVVLAIDEPELHQHPASMRHLARLFRAMSDGEVSGVIGRMQVVYTTHSPHFVFADRIDHIRLVSKGRQEGGRPPTTSVNSTTSACILRELKCCNAAYATDGAIDYSLLRAMGPAASEGFFADAVVLTEGPSDRIALLGAAEVMGHQLDSLGVSVISCGSKMAIPLPLVMFRRLGIPAYAIWDADKNVGNQKRESKRIVSALGYRGTDWRGKTTATFACLPRDLEDAIRSDLARALGSDADEDPYEAILNTRRVKYNLGQFPSKQIKTHLVMEEVKEKGIHLERLESIVEEIVKLSGGYSST